MCHDAAVAFYSPDRDDLRDAGAPLDARERLLARHATFSRWDGSQTVPDLEADEILDALADDLMSEGDLEAALRRLMERGWQSSDPTRRDLAGLQDLMQRLRDRRQELLQRYNLGDTLSGIREELEEIVAEERAGVQRRLDEAARPSPPRRPGRRRRATAEREPSSADAPDAADAPEMADAAGEPMRSMRPMRHGEPTRPMRPGEPTRPTRPSGQPASRPRRASPGARRRMAKLRRPTCSTTVPCGTCSATWQPSGSTSSTPCRRASAIGSGSSRNTTSWSRMPASASTSCWSGFAARSSTST